MGGQDRQIEAAGRTIGDEPLAGRRKGVFTTAALGRWPLAIGQNGLIGPAEMTLIEPSAGRVKPRAAGDAGRGRPLAIREKRGQWGATVVTVFDF